MNGQPLTIRPGTADDWPAMWPIFRSIISAGETYAFPEDLTMDQARPWWMEPPPGQTVVAESGGVIAGSAKMGPNRPGRGAHIATASFMVDPAAQGRGIGRALGEHVIDWAGAAGYRGIQFNAVVETNTAAVHLWRELGFQIIGTVPAAFAHPARGYVGLHVMYLPL
jgi:GNAT superfamily N-acetyltransferase